MESSRLRSSDERSSARCALAVAASALAWTARRSASAAAARCSACSARCSALSALESACPALASAATSSSVRRASEAICSGECSVECSPMWFGLRSRDRTSASSGTMTRVLPSLPGWVRQPRRRARILTASADWPKRSPAFCQVNHSGMDQAQSVRPIIGRTFGCTFGILVRCPRFGNVRPTRP